MGETDPAEVERLNGETCALEDNPENTNQGYGSRDGCIVAQEEYTDITIRIERNIMVPALGRMRCARRLKMNEKMPEQSVSRPMSQARETSISAG